MSLLLQRWANPQLQWDPETFGSVEDARLPVDKMWKPDLKHYTRYIVYIKEALKTKIVCVVCTYTLRMVH